MQICCKTSFTSEILFFLPQNTEELFSISKTEDFPSAVLQLLSQLSHLNCVIKKYLSTLVGLFVFYLRLNMGRPTLTFKAPRKPASENVVCLCHLLNILANFSNLFLHTGKQCGPRSDCRSSLIWVHTVCRNDF